MHHSLIRITVLVLAATGCSTDTTAVSPPIQPALSPSSIDQVVEDLMSANDVKGLAVVLIDNGEIVFSNGYGYRMVEKDLPLQLDTIIYGASLTKATFAYFVMQLVDERAIELDRSIADYLPKPLPEYDNYNDLAGDSRWRKLTMRGLLSHSSGFANYRRFDPAEDNKLRLHFSPGDRYAYSGEGFELAQFVLEEGLGLDVGAQMQTRIFDKLGMNKTSMTWREDFRENYSHNYNITGENVRHGVRSSVSAAGSMDTTANDWSKFLLAVIRGEGLTKQSRQEMTSPQIRIQSATQFPTLSGETTQQYDSINLSYGLGWGTFESPRGRAFFKEGHDDGTANYALCIEAEQSCILLMSNSVRVEGIFKELVDKLYGETRLPWRWNGYIPYNQN